MSSPGGNEVGRVSIRVLPDTSGFRQKLKTELEAINDLEVKVEVKFDIDTAELRSRLAALNPTIRARVVTDDPDVDNNVNLNARLNIDNAHFRAQVARINPVRLDARVDIDENRISNAIRRAMRRGERESGGLDLIGGGGGGGDSGGALGKASGAMFLVYKYLALAVAIAPLLSIAGAAITAAWGTVATVIAAVPAALGLLAIPLTTAILGFDSIKKAASSLRPEVEGIKRVVNEAFGTSLYYVLENIRSLLVGVTGSFGEVATALGGLAVNISNVLVRAENLARIQGIFSLAANAVSELNRGLQDIIDSLLIVAFNKNAFDALVEPINRFGAALKESVTALDGNGTLDRAFKGLEGLLSSLAEGFVALVDNGIKVFAAAAPGVTKFFDDLTGFFNRFDYNRLGTAVGDVFSGLGEALRKVPDGTIERITKAFESLGRTFKNADFQRDVANLVDTFGALVEILDKTTRVALSFVSVAGGVIDVIAGIAEGSYAAFQLSTLQIDLDEFNQRILDAGIKLTGGAKKIRDGLFDVAKGVGDGGSAISAASGSVAKNLGSVLASVGETVYANVISAASNITGKAFNSIGAGVLKAGQAIVGNVRTAVDAVIAATKSLDTGLKPGDKDYAPPWNSATQGIPNAVQGNFAKAVTASLSGASATAGAAINAPATGKIVPFWTSVFQSLSGTISVNGAGMALAASTAASKTATATTDGLGKVPAAAGTALAPVVPAVSTALSGVSLAIAAQLVLATVTVGLYMAAIVAAVARGVESIKLAFSNIGLSTGAFTQAFTILVTTVTIAMAAVSLAVQVGLNAVRAAFAGFSLSVSLVVTIFNLMAAGVQAAMLRLTLAVVAGLASVNAALTAFRAFLLTFGAAWITLGISVTTAMALIVAAVLSGMAQVRAAVSTALVAITALFVASGFSWTISVINAMNAITAAIRNGMAASLGAVRSGAAQMVSALNAVVGQFRAAGANMGSALAAGLRSKTGEVRAAAAELANAAAAATAAAAKIASPSRVFIQLGLFMGSGLSIGFDKSRNVVQRSAQRIVSVVVDSVTQINDAIASTNMLDPLASSLPSSVTAVSGVANAEWQGSIDAEDYGGIGDQVSQALAGWSVVLDANGVAKLVNKANTRKARR